MLDGDGNSVRTLVRERREPAGRVSYTWDGRDNAQRIVTEARYRPRVELERHGRTIVLPNPIRVDTTAPKIRIVRSSHGCSRRTATEYETGHGDVRARRARAPMMPVDGQRRCWAVPALEGSSSGSGAWMPGGAT
jgi:hypothetical protein